MISDKKHWRFIFTGENDAFFNMALDEAILRSCQRGESIPTLRLYRWQSPGITIGYFQAMEDTVDINKCEQNNIDVVRRITGGRAVLHENEITYSLSASNEIYPELGKNINETYQKISFALLQSLKELKVLGQWVKPNIDRIESTQDFSKPCFMSTSRYEITVGGKKLIGSAQRRFSESGSTGQDSFIQHGSIPLDNGRFNLADLLSPESFSTEEYHKKILKKKLKEKSTNLGKILKRKVEAEELISALKKGFSDFFNIEMIDKEPTEEEIEVTQMLKEKKYSTEEWNFGKYICKSKRIRS